MRVLIIAIAAVASLAGCASTELLNSGPDQVVIKADHRRTAEAQVLADAECQKFGKTARLNQSVPANVAWGTLFFDCR